MTTIVRHRKRGTTYTIIGRATAQVSTTPILEGQQVAVYRGEDGQLWVRGDAEFRDGRFEDVTPKRKWWPEDFVDEAMPEGTFSPDDWILGRCGETWVMAPPDRNDARDHGLILVRAGDEVAFAWNEPRGRDKMLIYPDGTWSLEAGEPDDWTHVFDDDDFENSGDSLDDFARDNRDMAGLKEGDEPIRIDVAFIKWGDARFQLDFARGEARFVPAAASDTAKVREDDARGDMGSGDRAGGTPPIRDWTVEDSHTAREILSYLGIGSDASLEPGADRRRDKVAAIICAAREGASHV